MRTALLLLLALAASGLSGTAPAADVWKWVDAKGITHYSDQPVPGAVKIAVRAGNVAEAPSAAPPVSSEPDSSSQTAGMSYVIDIVQPQSNQSIVNTAGQVNVQLHVEPNVQQLHRVSLYLDGKLVTGFPRNALSYVLTEVPRGTHNVSAAITDETGKTMRESAPVQFTVRQESVAKPPVGPSLRPPPKPPGKTGNKMSTTQPSYGTLNGTSPAVDPATNLPVVKKPAPKPGKP